MFGLFCIVVALLTYIADVLSLRGPQILKDGMKAHKGTVTEENGWPEAGARIRSALSSQ